MNNSAETSNSTTTKTASTGNSKHSGVSGSSNAGIVGGGSNTVASANGGGTSTGDTSTQPPLQTATTTARDCLSLGCGPSSSSTMPSSAASSSSSPSPSIMAAASATAVNGHAKTTAPFTSSNHAPQQQQQHHQQPQQRIGLPLSVVATHHHQQRHVLPTIAQTLQHPTTAHLTPLPPINLSINTTTGGNFGVTVDPHISVENLKKIISKKLKVAKDRICLLHREKELQDGSLKDNNLMDGSKIILIPNVETGLLAQRPENTVMQALESLNDSQVNDFLSGKTPLNLSMRLGDHMMLIQLQLSTVNPANGSSSSNAAASSASSGSSTSSTTNANGCSNSSRTRSNSQRSSSSRAASLLAGSAAIGSHHSHHHHHHHHHHPNAATVPTTIATLSQANTSATASSTTVRKMEIDSGGVIHTAAAAAGNHRLTTSSSTTAAIKSSDLSSFLSKRDYESLQNIVKSIAMAQPARLAAAAAATQNSQPQVAVRTLHSTIVTPTATAAAASATKTGACSFHTTTTTEAALLEQSPIKSLSNLVSSPIKTTAIKNIPIAANGTNSSSTSSAASNAAVTSSAAAAAAAATMASLSSHIAAASNGVTLTPTVTAVSACQDPIAAKLTSCLCTRLAAGSSNSSTNTSADNLSKNCIESTCVSRQDIAAEPRNIAASMLTSTPNNYKNNNSSISGISAAAITAPVTQALLHKTANNPIARTKHRHHHHHHHHHHHYHHNGSTNGVANNTTSSSSGGTNLSKSASTPMLLRSKMITSTPRSATTAASSNTSTANDSGIATDDSLLATNGGIASTATTTTVLPASSVAAAAVATVTNNCTTPVELDDSGVGISDTRTLAEASRNLTQTLRKLSKEVFTNKIDLSGSDETPRKGSSGAVIESMKNHGKGIYSGTFSGTLNPALQDRYGRPKRDISTVIHILNDLLSATPQYSRGARISFEAPTTSAAAANAANSATHSSSRSKQLSSKHHHHHACAKCNMKTPTSAHSHSNCAYGECNGHYTSKTSATATTKTNYSCCPEQSNSCNAAAGSTASTSNDHSNDRHICTCRYRINETGEREREHTCQKCNVEMDNLKTKSKLDQLRLVMLQSKQKREARKLKGAPYGARIVGATATANGILAADNAKPTTVAAAATASAATATDATSKTPLSSGTSAGTLSAATAAPNEVSPNHIVEEVDTAA